MALVYTSGSGAPGDQFDHPTVNASRTVKLQEVSSGTTLPDGTYVGQPLTWDGSAWLGTSFVAVESVQAPVDATGLLSVSGSGVSAGSSGVLINATSGQTVQIQTNAIQRFEAGDSYASLVATDSSVSVNDVGEIDISTPGAVNISGSSSVSLAWSAGTVNMTAAGLAFGSTALGFFGATPVAQPSITGALPQDQIDSLVSALVALGLVTDDR